MYAVCTQYDRQPTKGTELSLTPSNQDCGFANTSYPSSTTPKPTSGYYLCSHHRPKTTAIPDAKRRRRLNYGIPSSTNISQRRQQRYRGPTPTMAHGAPSTRPPVSKKALLDIDGQMKPKVPKLTCPTCIASKARKSNCLLHPQGGAINHPLGRYPQRPQR